MPITLIKGKIRYLCNQILNNIHNSESDKKQIKNTFSDAKLEKKFNNMDYLQRFNVKQVLKSLSENEPIVSDNGHIPKISVITASYNQGHFLERTILSVLNQKYPNFELIIIDGGSTDNSVEIIKKYEKYITYWVSEKDHGQTHAINKGLALATGDLLCFQNSDDVFCKNAFQILHNFYLKKPNYDGYFGDMLFIDANDQTLEILKTANFDIKLQVLEGMQIFNQSFFFTKKIVEKYGALDQSLQFVLDYENVLRWASNGAKFAKVPGLMGAFRIHDDAKTNQIQDIRKKEHDSVQKKYFGLLFANNSFVKLVYIWCRLKKLLYFFKKLDFRYIQYRYSLKK